MMYSIASIAPYVYDSMKSECRHIHTISQQIISAWTETSACVCAPNCGLLFNVICLCRARIHIFSSFQMIFIHFIFCASFHTNSNNQTGSVSSLPDWFVYAKFSKSIEWEYAIRNKSLPGAIWWRLFSFFFSLDAIDEQMMKLFSYLVTVADADVGWSNAMESNEPTVFRSECGCKSGCRAD